MKKRQLYVDARTKIFLMLVMNIVLLNTGSGAFLSCLRFVIGFLPGIMFLLIRRYKTAGLYTAIYAGSYFIMEYVLASVSGIAAILLGFLASMGTTTRPRRSSLRAKPIHCIVFSSLSSQDLPLFCVFCLYKMSAEIFYILPIYSTKYTLTLSSRRQHKPPLPK